ncbi:MULTISPECIES: MBL fold metallo-hydrolase [unclassified Methylobacterium]|uniref:MBL fold metallo-hydrolase n=1 Tax=unclassified Methylobacterium TaxID=2615210 RepID=UPI002269F996|nr:MULTISPECIES: MBL fold metallo-hydrolase [unclassified Methylobacterium]
MKQIVVDAWLLTLGNANAILLKQGSELALIDAGFPGKEQIVFDAISALGRRPTDLKHLVFTHGHPDHIGSAAAIVRATGARTYMHAADVPLAESGGPFRPMAPAPGLVHALMYKLVWNQNERMEPFRIDQHIADGETLPILGGLQAIHVPGHCAGQVALMWQGRRLLLGGDTFIHILGVSDPIAFEDEAEGRASQRKLAALDFQAVAFGHGKAIIENGPGKLQRFVARR